MRHPVLAKYRARLVLAQEEARQAGRGIWAGVTNVSLAIAGVQAKTSSQKAEALTEEYIIIENRGTAPVNLTGWTVQDEANTRYLFPNFVLAAGARVILRTGVGMNSATNLYWGSRKAVWNDSGDTILVKNVQGRVVLAHVY